MHSKHTMLLIHLLLTSHYISPRHFTGIIDIIIIKYGIMYISLQNSELEERIRNTFTLFGDAAEPSARFVALISRCHSEDVVIIV